MKCDSKTDTIIFQPFIAWNGNYEYQGMKLDGSKGVQFQNGFTFFSEKNFSYKEILKSQCETETRFIRFFLARYELTIAETQGKKSWVVDIDLKNDAGSPWANGQGPLYRLESKIFGEWSACKSSVSIRNADIPSNKGYTCTPITGGTNGR